MKERSDFQELLPQTLRSDLVMVPKSTLYAGFASVAIFNAGLAMSVTHEFRSPWGWAFPVGLVLARLISGWIDRKDDAVLQAVQVDDSER